jgi:putative oxidoreductase
MSFGHGLNKFPPSDGFVESAAKMGFPLPGFFAWAASLSEFVGGLLIALGVFVRPAAFCWICTMSVAAFVANADEPFSGKEKALLFLVIGVCLLLTGGGKYSLSKVLFKKQHVLL